MKNSARVKGTHSISSLHDGIGVGGPPPLQLYYGGNSAPKHPIIEKAEEAAK